MWEAIFAAIKWFFNRQDLKTDEIRQREQSLDKTYGDGERAQGWTSDRSETKP